MSAFASFYEFKKYNVEISNLTKKKERKKKKKQESYFTIQYKIVDKNLKKEAKCVLKLFLSVSRNPL